MSENVGVMATSFFCGAPTTRPLLQHRSGDQ
jgi:hypothetical protein